MFLFFDNDKGESVNWEIGKAGRQEKLLVKEDIELKLIKGDIPHTIDIRR